MLSNLFRRLVDFSPKLSFFGWKYFYEVTARLFRRMASWKFMNYGYADENITSAEYEVLCANLYRHLLDQVKFKEQSEMLEVGCGRGGGTELLLQYKPKMATGLDFSKNVIKFCQGNYKDARLKFVTGNAENLPFSNESFDVIINVESSHCYGDRKLFFKEVIRVLRPGGYFLYTDFMGRIHYPKRPVQLEDAGFTVLNEQEITPNVIRSMDLSKDFKEKLANKIVIKPLRKPIADFAGLPGSNIYNKFASGETIYFSIVSQKKEN
ncbi:MAG: SAM-dependent methyltransferase [Pedobacter sp.]|nr:MAG: SAM-dependent methyltransferase [Pedobacter sp.]